MAHLSLASQTFSLDQQNSILGRFEPADIVLPFAQISRHRAEVRRDGNLYQIVDLESRNGTFLDGREVGERPEELRDGSRLVLGGAVELLFVDPAETAKGKRIGRLRGVWLAGAEVWVNGHPLDPPLSAHQRRLLERLCESAGEFVGRDEVALRPARVHLKQWTNWPRVGLLRLSGNQSP